MSALWDIELTYLEGGHVTLGAYRGKVILIVNLPSGDLARWSDFEHLQQRYGPHDFVVLGFPYRYDARSFENGPGEVRAIADARGITYPLFAIVGYDDTYGPSAHPLFRALEDRIRGGEPPTPRGRAELVSPNVKTLLTRDGKVMQRYHCRLHNVHMEPDIEALVFAHAAADA